MRYEIKRIEIWPVIKVVTIFSLLLGFFIGLFYAFLMMFISRFSSPLEEFGASELTSLGSIGITFIIVFCLVFVTLFNVLAAAVFTALYNLLAGWIGGLTVELEPKSDQGSIPVG